MLASSRRFACPCCGFPSLSSLGAITCSICWWESDGLDLPDDEVRDNPNAGFSLSQARQNFQSHGHMYEAGKAGIYLSAGSEGRKRLLDYVAAIQSGQSRLDQETLDRFIAEEREYWPWRQQEPDLEQEETMLRALLALAAISVDS
ncbi:MAG: CPCC family cysteine-rich protein [Pseudomonadota bacterium]